MQCGSAKGSIEGIIKKVLAIRLSAGVKSQDPRRESRGLGMKDCFQGGGITLARKRQYNGANKGAGQPSSRGNHLSLSTRRFGTPCSQPGRSPFGKQP